MGFRRRARARGWEEDRARGGVEQEMTPMDATRIGGAFRGVAVASDADDGRTGERGNCALRKETRHASARPFHRPGMPMNAPDLCASVCCARTRSEAHPSGQHRARWPPPSSCQSGWPPSSEGETPQGRPCAPPIAPIRARVPHELVACRTCMATATNKSAATTFIASKSQSMEIKNSDSSRRDFLRLARGARAGPGGCGTVRVSV